MVLILIEKKQPASLKMSNNFLYKKTSQKITQIPLFITLFDFWMRRSDSYGILHVGSESVYRKTPSLYVFEIVEGRKCKNMVISNYLCKHPAKQ